MRAVWARRHLPSLVPLQGQGQSRWHHFTSIPKPSNRRHTATELPPSVKSSAPSSYVTIHHKVLVAATERSSGGSRTCKPKYSSHSAVEPTRCGVFDVLDTFPRRHTRRFQRPAKSRQEPHAVNRNGSAKSKAYRPHRRFLRYLEPETLCRSLISKMGAHRRNAHHRPHWRRLRVGRGTD